MLSSKLLANREYFAAHHAADELENEQSKSRDRMVEIENLRTQRGIPKRKVIEWARELEALREREPLLLQQLEDARQTMDRIRGRISPELCQPTRAEFAKHIKTISAALESIIKANRELIRLRDALESNGISASSLGPALFRASDGVWLDAEGFPLESYRRQIREYFPEIRI